MKYTCPHCKRSFDIPLRVILPYAETALKKQAEKAKKEEEKP